MSEEVKESIKAYFEELGEAVGEAVYEQLRRPGGMQRLLRRLNIPNPGELDKQYAALLDYFRENGTDEFLQIAGKKPLDFHLSIQPENTAKREQRYEIQLHGLKEQLKSRERWKKMSSRESKEHEDAGEEEERRVAKEQPPKASGQAGTPSPSKTSSQTYTIKPAIRLPSGGEEKEIPEKPQSGPSKPAARPENALEEKWETDEEGLPVGPLRAGPPPEPGTYDKTTPSWDRGKPYNPQGTWPEYERRTGRERRRKPDRRAEVDIVFKNKRYGGDRRKQGERRKNWPAGGHE